MGDFGTFSWNHLRDSLLNELDEGVCVFDRTHTMIAWNEILPGLLDLPVHLFGDQKSFEEVLAACAARGDFGDGPCSARQLLTGIDAHNAPIKLKGSQNLILRLKPLTRQLNLAVFSKDHHSTAKASSTWDSNYRRLINQAAAPIVIHRDEKILFVNNALSEHTKIPAEFFIGQNIRSFVPEDEIPTFEERTGRDEIGLWEVRLVLPDGKIYWAEVANAEVEWEGAPAWQVTLQDVTSRKAAEEILQRQAIVMQQVGEGVVISDLAGSILDCNESACSIYQIPRDQMIGSNVRALAPEHEDQASYIAQINAEIEKTGSWYEKTTYTRPDGTMRNVDVSVSAWRGPDDVPLGRITVIRDSTERRQAQKAVEQTETKFRNLIEGSLQGVMIHRDATIVYVNKATADLFGTDAIAMTGRQVGDFIDPSSADARDRFFNHDIAERLKIRATRDDGSTIWLEVNARSVDWDGAPARQVMINDITERQQAEEALQHTQKLESLGQLTGGIAHDFNNLLGVISGNLELLREQLSDSEDHSMFIEASLRSVRRGAELTQRLLAFSRKTPLKPVNTEINKLLQSMSGMMQRTLGEIISVETDLDDLAWSVSVDPGQMENAILNLALNARDAMPRGGQLVLKTQNVVLKENLIRHNSVVPAGEYLKVSVSDSGTGMPAEVVENAFQPFYTTKEVGTGSGLGLSMVYGFVQQSDGHIYIDTTPGRGTSIHMFLPKCADQPQAAHINGESVTAPPGNKEVVMVVEDDEDLRQLSVVLLNRMGYQTHEAADGPSAIALLDDLTHIDLLFTDLVLPGGLGGFEIAKAAKEEFPGIKVLFTSGYSESDAFREAFEDGRAELIPKPYRKDALAERLQAVLQS